MKRVEKRKIRDKGETSILRGQEIDESSADLAQCKQTETSEEQSGYTSDTANISTRALCRHHRAC